MGKSYSGQNFTTCLACDMDKPLDGRSVVDTYNDLKSGIFGNYAYNGMRVTTKDTGDIYVLKDKTKITQDTGWKKSGGVTDAVKYLGTVIDITDGTNILGLKIGNTLSIKETSGMYILSDVKEGDFFRNYRTVVLKDNADQDVTIHTGDLILANNVNPFVYKTSDNKYYIKIDSNWSVLHTELAAQGPNGDVYVPTWNGTTLSFTKSADSSASATISGVDLKGDPGSPGSNGTSIYAFTEAQFNTESNQSGSNTLGRSGLYMTKDGEFGVCKVGDVAIIGNYVYKVNSIADGPNYIYFSLISNIKGQDLTSGSYLPLSGDTMTGTIKFNNNNCHIGYDATNNRLKIASSYNLGIAVPGDIVLEGNPNIVPNTNGGSIGSTSHPFTAAYTASGFYQTSDIRKKNIREELSLEKAYDLVDKCQTILYDLKDDENHKLQLGLIAQEVEEFFPEIITTDENSSKSLDYSRLTVIILRVLKDVIDRIKKLENHERE